MLSPGKTDIKQSNCNCQILSLTSFEEEEHCPIYLYCSHITFVLQFHDDASDIFNLNVPSLFAVAGRFSKSIRNDNTYNQVLINLN